MLTEKQRRLLENEIYRIAKNRLNEWEQSSRNKGNEESQRKKTILKWLKSDSTKHSALAYELFNVPDTASEEDKGAARSLFSKKLRNAKNDNGSIYDFTKAEINKLWSIMNRK